VSKTTIVASFFLGHPVVGCNTGLLEGKGSVGTTDLIVMDLPEDMRRPTAVCNVRAAYSPTPKYSNNYFIN
jgi:hypothetical protein